MEHWNEEAGSTWMGRLLRHYPRAAWINPATRSLGLHQLAETPAPDHGVTGCFH